MRRLGFKKFYKVLKSFKGFKKFIKLFTALFFSQDLADLSWD